MREGKLTYCWAKGLREMKPIFLGVSKLRETKPIQCLGIEGGGGGTFWVFNVERRETHII